MFIPVTIHHGVKVLVNFDMVKTVHETNTGSMIYFSSKDQMDVQETIEQLYDILRKENKK